MNCESDTFCQRFQLLKISQMKKTGKKYNNEARNSKLLYETECSNQLSSLNFFWLPQSWVLLSTEISFLESTCRKIYQIGENKVGNFLCWMWNKMNTWPEFVILGRKYCYWLPAVLSPTIWAILLSNWILKKWFQDTLNGNKKWLAFSQT